MADTCGLNLDEIIQEKVKKNAEKYPVEKAYGHKEKYTELGKGNIYANVKHFFTLLGKIFFTSYGKEFFTYHGKQIFTS